LLSLTFSRFGLGRFFILLIFFIYFSIIFFLGGDAVPDRENYIFFFENPASSRFEPLFKYWGQVLLFLRIDSFLALYLTASLAFLFSFLVCSTVFRDNLKFLLFFGFVFFVFLSVFSFVQIRASVSLWVGLFLFLKIFDSGKKIYIFLLFLVPFIHFLMVPFVLAATYGTVLKRIGFFECLATLCVLLVVVVGHDLFVGLVPHGEYYGQYFDGVLKNEIWLSFSVLSYYVMVFFAVYFSRLMNVRFNDAERFSFLGLPLVLVGYFFGVDLFVKFAAPFMFLSAALFFRRLLSVKKNGGNSLVLAVMSVLLILTMAYPALKYV